jgi:hypothetical protein
MGPVLKVYEEILGTDPHLCKVHGNKNVFMNSDDAAGYHLRIPPLSPVT